MNSWKKFTFSITGKKHKVEGVVCQDAVSSWVNGDRGCVVLADGAGSAKFSRIGALVACNYIKSLFEKGKLKNDFIDLLRKRIKKHAEKREQDIKDFASTLLFIGVERETYKLIHIGDGLIACLYENGSIRVLSEGYKGEYANETVFITSENVENFIIYKSGNWVQEEIRAFFLMSDGMQQVLYQKSTGTFGKALYKIYSWFCAEENLERLKRQIKSQRKIFYQRTYDDLSLCILGRI